MEDSHKSHNSYTHALGLFPRRSIDKSGHTRPPVLLFYGRAMPHTLVTCGGACFTRWQPAVRVKPSKHASFSLCCMCIFLQYLITIPFLQPQALVVLALMAPSLAHYARRYNMWCNR